MLADLLAGLVGLLLGYPLNLLITGLPQERPLWTLRHRCRLCGSPWPGPAHLPLGGYLWQKGRCPACQGRLSWRYPLVDLSAAVLAYALWARFPASPALLAYAPFAAALVVLSALDLEHRWLPDVITLPGIALGLALALILPHLRFLDALLGAVLGAVFFQVVNWLYEKITRRQGMGRGDVKLLALIGAFLGFRALPLVVLVSAGLGSLAGLIAVWRYGRFSLQEFQIPYGPFLALAALLYLLVLAGPN
ncbi:MAG: A24 family peptidase [Thermodesulfobacteriota bacterium]